MSVYRMAVVATAYSKERTRSSTTVDVHTSPVATLGVGNPGQNVADVARAILTYIPTEIVTVYVAAAAAINVPGSPPATGQWVLMLVTLILTPSIVWSSYALTLRAAGKQIPKASRKWPWLEMLLATVAFVIWSFSLPGSPYESLSWYKPALGSVVLLVGTLVIGIVGGLARPSASSPAGYVGPLQ